MERKIKGLIAFGLSRGLIVPLEWLREMGYNDNDYLSLDFDGKQIIIRKVPNNLPEE